MTEMDQGARAWLLKTAKTNYWRVAAWQDLDDLIQDGFVCYQRVIAKYEERNYTSPTGAVTKGSPRIRTRAHIMGLFKVCYVNHINYLSKQSTLTRVEVLAYDLLPNAGAEDTVWDELQIEGSELLDYERLIVEAPPILQKLLRTLMTDEATTRLRSAYRVMRDGRETMNDRLCKLIGIDPARCDVALLLRHYLQDKPIAA